MWQSVTNFARRHRRKFLVVGGIIGGVYIFKRFIASRLSSWENQQTQDFFDQMKRYHHFEGTLQTCDSTVYSLLPKIRETVNSVLNVDELVEQLKSKPDNVLQTWEELKILVFVESFGEMTGHILFVCFLRVQLSIIGGYMYIDTQRNKTINGENGISRDIVTCSQEIQQRYLACIHHFFEVGLQEVFGLIRDSVQSAVSDITLKQKMQLKDFHSIFSKVKEAMFNERNGIFSQMSSYLIPDDNLDLSMWTSNANMTLSDTLYQKMLLETKDILETKDFQQICIDSFDMGFRKALEHMSFCFGSEPIPMAKLIPALHNNFKHSQGNIGFIQELLHNEPSKTFAANIYEAFSQPTDIDHNIRGARNINLES